MKFPIKRMLLLSYALAGLRGFLQLSNPFPRILPKFHPRSKFRRHFLLNLFVGVCIEIVVHLSGHYWHLGIVVDTQNAALDMMMKLSADIPSKVINRPTQLFIDVDEKTYRDQLWGGGEPKTLPLNKIADLIKYASTNGARYVVVDFVIDGLQDEQQDEFISRMEDILKEYPKSHFLFVRTLRQPIDRSTVKAIRYSFALDHLIANYPDNVHAVTPNFLRSSDQVLRHWRLWESACYQLPGKRGQGGEGHWVIVPSPQLMITSLEKGSKNPWPLILSENLEGLTPPKTISCAVDVVDKVKPDSVDQVHKQAQSAHIADWEAGHWVKTIFNTCYQQDSFKEKDCDTDSRPPEKLSQKEVIMKIEGEELANRILFRFSDLVRKSGEDMQHGKKHPFVEEDQNFFRLPAINFLIAPPLKAGPAAYAIEKFKNASQNKALTIASIGASYEDSRDSHITPLGVMPGSLVIINAIDTLQTIGILQSLPSLGNFLMITLTLICISAIFALLSGMWASILLFGIIAVTMGPLSFWFLKQGIWLDLGAPIIGIYLHREWEDLKDKLSNQQTH